MSQVSSNHSQDSGNIPAPSSERPDKLSLPGWPEVIIGLVVFAVVGYGGGSQLSRLGLDPVATGLVFTALSGVAGIAGFAAAAMLRIRSLGAFGVRRTSTRWLLIEVGAGVVAFVLKGLAGMAYVAITGDSSTAIFAIGHGVNIVLPAAVVMGLAGAELVRRTGSVWPAVVVYVVFNLPTVPALVLAGMGRPVAAARRPKLQAVGYKSYSKVVHVLVHALANTTWKRLNNRTRRNQRKGTVA